MNHVNAPHHSGSARLLGGMLSKHVLTSSLVRTRSLLKGVSVSSAVSMAQPTRWKGSQQPCADAGRLLCMPAAAAGAAHRDTKRS